MAEAGAALLGMATLRVARLVDRVNSSAKEAQLRRQFGGWYSDHAAAVRRWS